MTGVLKGLLTKNAILVVNKSDLIKGKFIVDMNSMTVDDIQGRGKERLENHLRNDDFFGVSNYKEAILTSIVLKAYENKNNDLLRAIPTLKWESGSVSAGIAVVVIILVV